MTAGLFVCIGIVGLIIILFLTKNEFCSIKYVKWVTTIFAIALALFAYSFTLKDFIRWDLLEHYKIIDQMREKGLTYVLHEAIYKDLYVINFYMYFISLLPSNKLFQTIPIFIMLMIFSYIIVDVYKTINKKKGQEKKSLNGYVSANINTTDFYIVFFIFFATFGYKLAVSGIRNVLVVSLLSLAVYWEYICGKKRFPSFLLYITGLFIHYFAAVVILLRLILFIPKIIKFLPILSITAMLCLDPLCNYLLKFVKDSSYITWVLSRALSIQDKYSMSNIVENFSLSVSLLYFGFIITNLWVAFSFRNFKKNNDTRLPALSGEDRIYNWAKVVSYIGVGLSLNYLLLERWMYILSYSCAMYMPYYFKRTKAKNILILLPVLLFVLFFNDIYLFLVNHFGTYFLGRTR